MRPFTYESPSSIEQATSDFGQNSSFLAGGTTLVDLMKLDVMKPAQVVDINQFPMHGIKLTSDGLRIGRGAAKICVLLLRSTVLRS